MIRTLFATHYHEMTQLEGTVEGVRNLNVDVAEENGDVVFLHKIVEGSASRSYGIHVAKLAGAPSELLERAQEHLYDLESSGECIADAAASAGRSGAAGSTRTTISETSCTDDETSVREACGAGCEEEVQLSMFASIPDPVTQRLRDLDLMDTTPSEALRILEELKKYL